MFLNSYRRRLRAAALIRRIVTEKRRFEDESWAQLDQHHASHWRGCHDFVCQVAAPFSPLGARNERAPVRQLADGVDEEHPAAQTRGAGLAIDGICRQDDVRGTLDADLQERSEAIWSGHVGTRLVCTVIQ